MYIYLSVPIVELTDSLLSVGSDERSINTVITAPCEQGPALIGIRRGGGAWYQVLLTLGLFTITPGLHALFWDRN